MNFHEYEEEAMSFRLPTANASYAMLGLSGEVGELHSCIAKAMRDGTELDRSAIRKELGDILWFVAAIADDYGLSLKGIAIANIQKLADRKARNVIKGSGDNR